MVVLLADMSLVTLSALEAVATWLVELKGSILPSSLTIVPILEVSFAIFFFH